MFTSWRMTTTNSKRQQKAINARLEELEFDYDKFILQRKEIERCACGRNVHAYAQHSSHSSPPAPAPARKWALFFLPLLLMTTPLSCCSVGPR